MLPCAPANDKAGTGGCLLTVAPFGGREATATLKHYQAFLDRDFYQVLTWRSLKLGLHVTFWCIVIGYPAALALARYVPGRWREALLLMVVLPFWSNALVRVFSWTMVLREGGLLDSAVRMIVPGAEPFDVLFTYDAIVIGLVHSFLPYMILTCYVSLQAIDDALIEAARTLGASGWVVFRRIILPLSVPGLFAGVILTFAVMVVMAFNESVLYELPFKATTVWFERLAENERLIRASANSVGLALANTVIATALGTMAALAFAVSFDQFVISYFLAPPGVSTLPVEIYSAIRKGFTPEVNAISSIIIAISMGVVLLFARLYRFGGTPADGGGR